MMKQMILGRSRTTRHLFLPLFELKIPEQLIQAVGSTPNTQLSIEQAFFRYTFKKLMSLLTA